MRDRHHVWFLLFLKFFFTATLFVEREIIIVQYAFFTRLLLQNVFHEMFEVLVHICSKLLKSRVVVFAERREFLENFRALMRVLFDIRKLIPHVLIKCKSLALDLCNWFIHDFFII